MIHVGENTWNLRVFVTDLQVEKTLRVKGEKNIGGVMVELVDSGTKTTKNYFKPKLDLKCKPNAFGTTTRNDNSTFITKNSKKLNKNLWQKKSFISPELAAKVYCGFTYYTLLPHF